MATPVDTTTVDTAAPTVVEPVTPPAVNSGSGAGSGENAGTSGARKASAPSDNGGPIGSQEPPTSDGTLNLSCFSLSLLTTAGADNPAVAPDPPKRPIFTAKYIRNAELFDPPTDGFTLADLLAANVKDRPLSDHCFGMLLVANATSQMTQTAVCDFMATFKPHLEIRPAREHRGRPFLGPDQSVMKFKGEFYDGDPKHHRYLHYAPTPLDENTVADHPEYAPWVYRLLNNGAPLTITPRRDYPAPNRKAKDGARKDPGSSPTPAPRKPGQKKKAAAIDNRPFAEQVEDFMQSDTSDVLTGLERAPTPEPIDWSKAGPTESGPVSTAEPPAKRQRVQKTGGKQAGGKARKAKAWDGPNEQLRKLTKIAEQIQEEDEAVESGGNAKSNRGKKARPNYSLSSEIAHDDSDSEDSLPPVPPVTPAPKQKIVLINKHSSAPTKGSVPPSLPSPRKPSGGSTRAKSTANPKTKTTPAPKKRAPVKQVPVEEPSPVKVNTAITRAERSRRRSEVKGDTDLDKAIAASKAELERKK
jgi:hypothetical protein